MTQPNITSFTWEIDNFTKLADYVESPKFGVKPNIFWLVLIPTNNILYRKKQITIIISRSSPYDIAQNSGYLKVLWTISLINANREECYPKVLESNFKAKSKHKPVDSSSYQLHRNAILDSSNGLLSRGKLTVKCTVRIIDDEANVNFANLSIETQKITFAHTEALENYQSLLDNPKFSDVVIVVGKKEFKLHKNILSAQSPVLAAMFDSDLEEARKNRVDIIDVDVEVFEAMIRFIYTGNVDSVQQYALDLFVAADKYQLDSLKDICAHSLGSNLSIESVAKILLLSEMHSAHELKSNCVKYINANATKVMVTEGWKQLVKNKNNNSVELLHELYRDIVAKMEIILN